MEQKNITTGNIITGAILIVVGIIILPLGLMAMFAYPDAVWVAGMVFTIIGGTLIFYGIRNIEIARSQEKKISHCTSTDDAPTGKAISCK